MCLGNLLAILQGVFPTLGKFRAICRAFSQARETFVQFAGRFPEIFTPFPKAMPLGYVMVALSGRLLVRKFINYRKCGKVEDLAIIQPNPTGWGNIVKPLRQTGVRFACFG